MPPIHHIGAIATVLTLSLAPYHAAQAQQAAAGHSHSATPTTTTSAQASKPAASTDGKPTSEFRKAHQEELKHLDQVEKWAGTIATAPADKQPEMAKDILKYFQEGLIPHAEWEEKHLYPLIDKLTESGKNPFTSTMRYEHEIVGRSIKELAAIPTSSSPDYTTFARKTDNLLGLVRAHFEKEDEVLLPYVDKTMTKEEFEKAVGGLDH